VNQAYAIQFKGGGYVGGGHAHGVPLYRAYLYETYEDAEKDRMELSKHWEEMNFSKVVRIIVSPDQ
jgi:hypothetical protein